MPEPAPTPSVVYDWTPEEARTWPLISYHAAGGVVVREGRVLLLRVRGGRVKLPKGRREAGETLEECALREVREESGLTHPAIVSRLGTGESRFAAGGHRYDRVETYYLMTSEDAASHGVEGDHRTEWCPLEEAERQLTYPVEQAAVRWAIAALRGGSGGHTGYEDHVCITHRDGEQMVWYVERLWEQARGLPEREIPMEEVLPYLQAPWGPVRPTRAEAARYAGRIFSVDLRYPIILAAEGYVMDGTHRIAKAFALGLPTIRAVRFPVTPEPHERRPSPSTAEK